MPKEELGMITFTNVCKLITRLKDVKKKSTMYAEAQILLKLEITGYNIERAEKLLEYYENNQ